MNDEVYHLRTSLRRDAIVDTLIAMIVGACFRKFLRFEIAGWPGANDNAVRRAAGFKEVLVPIYEDLNHKNLFIRDGDPVTREPMKYSTHLRPEEM